MQMRTPSAAAGLRLWTFPIKAPLTRGEKYQLRLWARGGDIAQTLHVGMEALWGSANVSCPMDAGSGQCSYTPRPITLELNVWKEYTFIGEAQFGELPTCSTLTCISTLQTSELFHCVL